MTANLKGGNALVRFLLAHGEKLGMGVVVLCAAMLIWSALGRERLEKGPEDLQNAINRANTNIQQARWESAPPEAKLIATSIDTEAMKPIPPEHFPKLGTSLDRAVLDPIGLRTDPQLLTAEDLEVHGDAGLWASADPAQIQQRQLAAQADEQRREKERQAQQGGQGEEADPRGAANRGGRESSGRRRGDPGSQTVQTRRGPIVRSSRMGVQLSGFETIKAESWVTVLAKVPVRQQYQLYEEALANARGYDAKVDIPEYIGYLVQRAEVTNTGLGDWETIATANGEKIATELDAYPVNVAPVIDQRYNHPLLTHPLPPLILREWDERVTHSSMPLEPLETPAAIDEAAEEKEEETPPAVDDIFGRRPASPRTRSRRGDDSRTSRSAQPTEGRSGASDSADYSRGEGSGYSRASGPSNRQTGAPLPPFIWNPTTSHVLLRFFDTSAEPGHKYRYRVRLGLKDVNDISSLHYLDPAVAERRAKSGKYYRMTDWSEPSPVASVPFPARIYLAGAKAASDANFNDESEADLLIKALSSKPPAEVARLESFLRGSVLNIRDEATVVWADQYDPEEVPEFDFRTGITLLDFRGGERLSSRNRDLSAPARAVFMDAAGRLFLQRELDDYEPVAEFQQIVEEAEESRRRSRAAASD